MSRFAAAARFSHVPQSYGAKANGIADDTAAIQSAINALPATGGTIILPPGEYPVTTVDFPLDRDVRVSGYGAVVRATTGAPAFRRMPADQTEALNIGTTSRLIVEGLTLKGDRTAGQVGLQIGASYGSAVRECSFHALDVGCDIAFGLMTRVTSCDAINCGTDGLVIRHGDWPRATTANSQSNHTVVEQFRNYAKAGMNSGIKVRESSGVVLRDCITEGGNPVWNIDFECSSTVVKTFKIENLHSENSPTGAIIRGAMAPGGEFNIDGVFFQLPGVMLDTTRATTATSYHIRSIPWWPVGSTIKLGGSNPAFAFEGLIGARDPTADQDFWGGEQSTRVMHTNGFYRKMNTFGPLTINGVNH